MKLKRNQLNNSRCNGRNQGPIVYEVYKRLRHAVKAISHRRNDKRTQQNEGIIQHINKQRTNTLMLKRAGPAVALKSNCTSCQERKSKQHRTEKNLSRETRRDKIVGSRNRNEHTSALYTMGEANTQTIGLPEAKNTNIKLRITPMIENSQVLRL